MKRVIGRHEDDRYARRFRERLGIALPDGEQPFNGYRDVRAEAVAHGRDDRVADVVAGHALTHRGDDSGRLHAEAVSVVRPFDRFRRQQRRRLEHILEVQAGGVDAKLHLATTWRFPVNLMEPQAFETSRCVDLESEGARPPRP